MLEGTKANIPPKGGRKHPEQDLVTIDTTNILFICGGAFQGINKIIKRRLKGNDIGFDRKKTLDIEEEKLIHKSLHYNCCEYHMLCLKRLRNTQLNTGLYVTR